MKQMYTSERVIQVLITFTNGESQKKSLRISIAYVTERVISIKKVDNACGVTVSVRCSDATRHGHANKTRFTSSGRGHTRPCCAPLRLHGQCQSTSLIIISLPHRKPTLGNISFLQFNKNIRDILTTNNR